MKVDRENRVSSIGYRVLAGVKYLFRLFYEHLILDRLACMMPSHLPCILLVSIVVLMVTVL